MVYFLLHIYLKVREDQRRSEKWRFGSQDSEGANWRGSTTRVEDGVSGAVALEDNIRGLEKLDAARPTRSDQSQETGDHRADSNDGLVSEEFVEQPSANSPRRQSVERKSHKRRQKRKRTELEKKVFWQCLSYFIAFMLVWPFPIVLACFQAITYENNVYVLFFVAFVTPLQGFANAMVYFRPRLQRSLLCRPCKGSSSPSLNHGRSSLQHYSKPSIPEQSSRKSTTPVEGRYSEDPDGHDLSNLDSQMAEWEPSMAVDDADGVEGNSTERSRHGHHEMHDLSIAMLKWNREQVDPTGDDDGNLDMVRYP